MRFVTLACLMALHVWFGLQSFAFANTPPTIRILAPNDLTSWPGTAQYLYAAASAQDSDGTITKVEFYAGDTLMGTVQPYQVAPPDYYMTQLPNRPAPGTYSCFARAYDNEGAFTDSLARTLVVQPLAPPPSVTTGSVTPYSVEAWLNGSFNVHGCYTPADGVSLEYGTTTAYGKIVTYGYIRSPAFTGTTDVNMSMPLSGLERNTTYHCRLVVTNFIGTTYGEDVMFTTAANLPPVAMDAFFPVPSGDPVPIYMDYSDPDRDDSATLTALSTPSHGTVQIGSPEPGAKLTYTPDSTFTGVDEFTFTVTDEHQSSVTATVRLGRIRNAGTRQFVTNVVTDGGGLRHAGEVAMMVTAGGNFTGVLYLLGEKYRLRGQFSVEGAWSSEFDRVGNTPVTVSLSYVGGSNGMMISGYISGSAGDYEIVPDAALDFPAKAPQAGRYTVSLEPTAPDVPQGDGYVCGSVSKKGRVGFVGRIGDGQAFSFGTQLRRGGTAQFYAMAGEVPKDRLHGRFQFPDEMATEATGDLVWYKAARTTGFYQAGFTTQVHVVGSRFDNPDKHESILDYTGAIVDLGITFKDEGDNTIVGGSLTTPNSSERGLAFINTTPAVSDRRAKAPPPQVQISIQRGSGAFSGKVRLDPNSSTATAFKGVLLQHQNGGAGYVLLNGKTGKVVLTPK